MTSVVPSQRTRSRKDALDAAGVECMGKDGARVLVKGVQGRGVILFVGHGAYGVCGAAGVRAGEKAGDEPFAQRVLHLFEFAGEEVVCIGHDDERCRLRCGRHNAHQRRLWAILVCDRR